MAPPRPTDEYRHPLWPLLAFTGLLIGSLLVFGFAEAYLAGHRQWLRHTLALTAVSGACVLPIFIHREMRENPFHLFSYYLIQSTITLAFGAVVFHYDFIDVDIPDYIFTETALVAAVSVALLYLGFKLPLGRFIASQVPLLVFPNNSSRRPENGWGPYLTSLTVLYVTGWATRMIGAALGHFHSGDGRSVAYLEFNVVWNVMPTFSTLSFLIIMGLWLSRRVDLDLPKIVPIGLIVLEVLAGAVDGSRSQMIMPLLLALIAYNYVRRKVSWGLLLAGFAAFIFIFLPLATLYRSVYRTNIRQGQEVSVDTALASASRASKRRNPFEETFGQALSRLTVRFQGLGRVLNRVPERYEFQRGETFVEGMYMSYIPRVLYPQKGFYNPTRRYGVLFFDNREDETTNNGITEPGELYFNYGYTGLVGLILLGIFFRFFWERFRLQARVEFMPLYRLHYLLFQVVGVSSFATYPAGLTRVAIIYYIGLVILHRRLPAFVAPSALTASRSN